jgi:chromosome segregation protein
MDVKLDNMLNTLSEAYNITYEKASTEYRLFIDIEEARNKVNSLKRKLRDIGMVNLAAIDEYDKVSERYEFLIKQKEDLNNAELTLLEIIEEMDNVMKEDFIKTFDIIKDNFTTTFKELFNGGTAELKLTDPGNILETGVEIIASPPGKKLTSISLLSGGEKTFTAISLLFAILKSRRVPFCILDEVEAALDDVNVGSFGKYLTNLATKTQFIVITHKKKTMEFVNNLYGITMQESGVSKLVSVKLEEIK